MKRLLVLMILSMMMAPVAGWAGDVWTQELFSETVNNPRDIEIVDLDLDGDQDILVAEEDNDTVLLFRNDGPGTYTYTTLTAAADGAYALKVIDFNKDASLDVLVACSQGDEIQLLLNDGHQNFTSTAVGSLFDDPRSVDVGDINGDGHYDIVATAYASDDLTWWESDGNTITPGFTEHVIFGVLDGAMGVKVLDMNNDNDTDIVVLAYNADDLLYLENTGNTTTVDFVVNTITTNYNGARFLDVADMNGDGLKDILTTASSDDMVTIWENHDNGIFNRRDLTVTFDSAFDIQAVDMDGDSDLDILASATNSDHISWWENRGSHSYQYHRIVQQVDNIEFVYAKDLDNDGSVDIVATNSGSDEIYRYKRHAAGSWEWSATVAPADAVSVAIAGTNAYVGRGNNAGLSILDIQNPANVQIIKELQFGSGGSQPMRWLTVSGNYLFASERKDSSMHIVNIASPANADEVGLYNVAASRAGGVAVKGTSAFIGDNSGNLNVVNIADVANPTETISYAVPNGSEIRGVKIVGNYAYLADYGNSRMHIVNITAPGSPAYESYYYISSSAMDLDVVGSYAYIASYDEGLFIIDISTPSAPTLVSTLKIQGYGADVDVVGNYAYFGTNANYNEEIVCGVYRINVSNPQQPVIDREYSWDALFGGSTAEGIRAVQVSGDYVYAASYNKGLLMLGDNPLPATPTVTPTVTVTPYASFKKNVPEVMTFPNPAKDEVRFLIKELNAEKVRIEVFNLSGEQVVKIEVDAPGQVVSWLTDNVAAGIYIYRTFVTVDGDEKQLEQKKLAIVK